jgi:hypothetical protein
MLCLTHKIPDKLVLDAAKTGSREN